MALIAFERRAVLHQANGCLAGRAGQNFEQFRVNGHRETIQPVHAVRSQDMRTAVLAVVISLLVPAWSDARQAAPAAAPISAQAYYEFMLARHLENKGDERGALDALKRAQTADPKSAEIKAELAGLYARQNKANEAVEMAEQALELNPESIEANRILGLVFAAWSDGAITPPAGRTQSQLRRDAITHLTRIIDTPAVATDLSLQVTLGRLHMRAGEPAKAIPVLEVVVSQMPYATEPYTLLADARIAVGRMDEAAEVLEMAAELNPRHYNALGELYERMGKWAAAADAYGRAVQAVRTPSRDLRMRLVGALLNVGEEASTERARSALRELIAANPKDARAWYLLSTAHRQLGDLSGAEDAARQMLAIDPTSLTGLYALAQVFFAQRDAKKVLDLLAPFAGDVAARAKGNESDAALVLSQLGFAHLQLGDPQRAIAMFGEAKKYGPDNAAYDAYLIQAHLSGKQFARAADLAADALARYPRDPRLISLRADALAETGRQDEALALLKDAISGAPDDDNLAMKLGAIFEEAGRIDEAEQAFRRIIDRDPLHAPALNYLGYMLADRGLRLPEAVALIERALKIDPDNPAYLDSLGWALFKQGKADEAEPPLRKAAEALGSESVIQDHFGDVLAQRGKTDEAIAAWERALKGDGDGIDRPAVEKKIKDARARRR
jgi:tetratricopeptide (TPR) repeat protein